MEKCKFCEMFEDIKCTHNHYKKDGFSKKYKCALVAETYCGEDYRGKTTYCGMEFNYCPECGRKLNNK